jgi:hypothetical protein
VHETLDTSRLLFVKFIIVINLSKNVSFVDRNLLFVNAVMFLYSPEIVIDNVTNPKSL